MDEIGAHRIEIGDIGALEDLQHLQQDGSLGPRSAFEDLAVAIGHGDRLLDQRLIISHVLGRDQALVAAPRNVPDLLGRAEFLDPLGDRPAIPEIESRIDARFPILAEFRVVEDLLVERRDLRVAEQLAGLGSDAAWQIELGRARPVGFEKLPHFPDRPGDARHQRMARAGIIDRRCQHVLELGRAVVAQQGQPGAEGAGNAGGQQAGARNDVEAEALEIGDGRLGG